MKIKYKPQEKETKETKLFGSSFVAKNKKLLKIIVNNKMKNLEEKIVFDKNQKPTIKLFGFKSIHDLSYMFSGCSSLFEIKYISKASQIDSKYIERKIKNIVLTNGIVIENNIFYQSLIFYGNLPLFHIIEWNTEKVINMNNMFEGCSSLISLPDISKWNIDKVINMNSTFEGCSSLLSLPDISKWNTEKVIDMSYMFYRCSSLKTLPDLSKWNTKEVIDMSYMFHECSLLKFLPDISKWNTENLKKVKEIFSDCTSLISLPDIYEWPIMEKIVINEIIRGSYSLKRIPIKHKPRKKINTKKDSIPNLFKDSSIKVENIKQINNGIIINQNDAFCGISKMIYNIEKVNESEIQIINTGFFGRNLYSNCKILYKNEIHKITDSIKIDDLKKRNENKLELFLLEKENITNRNEMFEGCNSLEEFSLSINFLEESFLNEDETYNKINSEKQNISNNYINSLYKMDETKVGNKKEFEESEFIEDDSKEEIEHSLLYKNSRIYKLKFSKNDDEIKDFIYKFNNSAKKIFNNSARVKNPFLTNLKSMFKGCSSLKYLPDLSKWNTEKVINISSMFDGCSSLFSLPNISKWNTGNIKSMSYIFNKCSKLFSLPDISKWNVEKVINMSYMFKDCSSLLSLLDLSKWNPINNTNISGMFNNCSSLETLPDISKWNTIKIKNMKEVFSDCSSLLTLPDISKWTTDNVEDMSKMMYKCSSLISLPDISGWNTEKVTNITSMFYGCSSLSSLPDLSKWEIKNVVGMHFIFNGCSSLYSIPNILNWNCFHVEYKELRFGNCISLIFFPDSSNKTNFFTTFDYYNCFSLIYVPKEI